MDCSLFFVKLATRKRMSLRASALYWRGNPHPLLCTQITDRLERTDCHVGLRPPRNDTVKPQPVRLGLKRYLTYSMTTRRLGSTPVEWVVMLSMSCRAAWITCRS